MTHSSTRRAIYFLHFATTDLITSTNNTSEVSTVYPVGIYDRARTWISEKEGKLYVGQVVDAHWAVKKIDILSMSVDFIILIPTQGYLSFNVNHPYLDELYVFTASFPAPWNDFVVVMNTTTGELLANIEVCNNPMGGTLDLTRGKLLVACNGNHSVYAKEELVKIDIATRTIEQRIETSNATRTECPYSVEMSPGDEYAFVSDECNDRVVVYDPVTLARITEFPVAAGPTRFASDPENNLVHVINEYDCTVTTFDSRYPFPVLQVTPVTCAGRPSCIVVAP